MVSWLLMHTDAPKAENGSPFLPVSEVLAPLQQVDVGVSSS